MSSSDHQTIAGGLLSPDERRRFPRFKVTSMIHGHWVELDLPVTIRDVSLGGFSVESPIAFPVGSDQTFLFSAADGRQTQAWCRCRHARATRVNGAPMCVAGFEFLPQPEEQLRIIIDTVRLLGLKVTT